MGLQARTLSKKKFLSNKAILNHSGKNLTALEKLNYEKIEK